MHGPLRRSKNAALNLYPLVVETLSFGHHPAFKSSKTLIARKTTLRNGFTISKALANLHEQLSVWKYNAKMVLDTVLVG